MCAVAKVLLVDDDVFVRRVVRTRLERAGYRVAEAGNGVEGLSAFEAEQPELVLTDICMPEMNGLEMMAELRRRRPGVQVIAMSGAAQPAEVEAALAQAGDLGATRTFAKPLDLGDLVRAVEELATA
jgi:CheY-like chemotaxis protein